MREGHLNALLELAEVASTKDNPSHWFARAASKAQWERTLDFLAKMREVARAAAEVVKRLTGVAQKVAYAACWEAKSAAVRHAVTAQETGRDAVKYFCWLV